MKKVCTDCGASNIQHAQACENCGSAFPETAITASVPETVPEVKLKQEELPNRKEQKICPNCSFENTQTAKFCAECGYSFSGKEANKVHEKHSSQGTVKKIKPTPKSETTQASAMDNKKVFAIFLGVLVLGMLILYYSGVFSDGTVVENTAVTDQHNHEDEKAGVDLNAVNQINDLEAKVKANPKDTASVIHLAHLMNDAGFFARAIPYYKDYLKVNQKSAETIIDMGVCYYGMKDYDTADSLMKAALKINPKQQIGMLNLGVINMARNNMDEAKKWLQKAIDTDPTTATAGRAKELLESHNH